MSDYLSRVRLLPCCICEKYTMIQKSVTTAHHTFCERFGTEKTDDLFAIPLCDDHHQGLWGSDSRKIAIHKNKSRWIELYGLDSDYVQQTRDAIKQEG